MTDTFDYSTCSEAELWRQAVLVARARPMDWTRIEHWCRGEGPAGTAAFEDLRRLCAIG